MGRRRWTGALCLLAFAGGGGAGIMWAKQQGQSTTRREPLFENAQVRVWKSVILPNQPLTLHRHEHGRVLVALTDGVLKVFDQDRNPVDSYTWQQGKAYWLDADPPGKLHGDLNDTTQPIEVIVVELQRDK